jgi:hypothetical protein
MNGQLLLSIFHDGADERRVGQGDIGAKLRHWGLVKFLVASPEL